MFKKIIHIFYLLSFLTFISSTLFFYFSEQNIIKINKSRSLYSLKKNDFISDLPLLKNDTNNIIEFKDDVDFIINKKKYYKFWDLIKK